MCIDPTDRIFHSATVSGGNVLGCWSSTQGGVKLVCLLIR